VGALFAPGHAQGVAEVCRGLLRLPLTPSLDEQTQHPAQKDTQQPGQGGFLETHPQAVLPQQIAEALGHSSRSKPEAKERGRQGLPGAGGGAEGWAGGGAGAGGLGKGEGEGEGENESEGRVAVCLSLAGSCTALRCLETRKPNKGGGRRRGTPRGAECEGRARA